MTEKLFHAFASGCLPIYYGTEDVARFLPTPKAALVRVRVTLTLTLTLTLILTLTPTLTLTLTLP